MKRVNFELCLGVSFLGRFGDRAGELLSKSREFLLVFALAGALHWRPYWVGALAGVGIAALVVAIWRSLK